MSKRRATSFDCATTGVATASMSAATAVDVKTLAHDPPRFFLPADVRGGEETLGRGPYPKSGTD